MPNFEPNREIEPKLPRKEIRESLNRLGKAGKVVTSALLGASVSDYLTSRTRVKPVMAIGDLYEFRDQSMVIQDISFNVQDVLNEVSMMKALFQNRCRDIRGSTRKGSGNALEATSTLGFGAEAYKSPSSFIPGVSDLFEDGGHATITLKSRQVGDDGVVEFYERGNGLAFIKIGTDTIRLSKAIQRGANIKFAYGWVDLDSPSGIPYQVIVGNSRDPFMVAALRVSSLSKSQQFFQEELGMQELPLPMARLPGSSFEPVAPPGAICLGYGVDSLALLLIPASYDSTAATASKGSGNDVIDALNPFRSRGEERNGPPLSSTIPTGPVVVGSQLEGITIVVDDLDASARLPPLARSLLSAQGAPPSLRVEAPDGYPFLLKRLSAFQKEATTSVPTADP